jgi:Mrp family chromosome partitioning ATPase
MRDFLEALRARFDVIIIDSPPVRVATDAVLLATQCDLTLVVVRAGQTKEGELDYTLEALDGVGAPVLGAVFNGFDVSMAYGHKYRFKHYDRYAQYTKKYGYYGYHRKVDALEDDTSV